jgi:hypothetical protein
VSDAIVLVHRFISSALSAVCDDRNVSDALADKLCDELARWYRNAIACAGFLLKVKKSNTPMKLNHYYLQRR